MLDINSVLSVAPDTSASIVGYARLLGVDQNNIAYLIRLDDVDPKKMKIKIKAPFQVSMSKLISEIMEGAILVGKNFDCGLPPAIEALSLGAQTATFRAMDILRPLVKEEEVLFDPTTRSIFLKKQQEKTGVNERQIRRYYYRYLWGGQTELALAPRYSDRGGTGSTQTKGSKRRGRKAIDENASKISLPDVRKKLEKGAKLYYLNGSRTLEEAFMDTKIKYFSIGARIAQTTVDRKTPIQTIFLPEQQLPTLRQFRYVCERLELDCGKRNKIPRRIRQKKEDWDFRGSCRDNVPGPGYRYEIDASKIQIRLVSRFNRSHTLKDATIYVIIDVWSGAIVGYSLSLQNASWALAAKALLNCFTDKTAVFERLGLDYDKDDWPCQQLPSRLAADRAEMVSNKASNVPEIGIKLEIMPPMCPERKGLVESSIKNIKHRHSHNLPGQHPKLRQRRESDGTNTAALTIDELEQIIVEIIVGLNHEPVSSKHIPLDLVESGETDVTHIGLYRWGLENRPGFTRTMPAEEVHNNLLSRGVANYTVRGLNFKGQTYSCSDIPYAQTYKRSHGRTGLLADIRYDEHQADRIWFLNKKTNQWDVAINNNPDIQRQKEGFYELEVLRKTIKVLRRNAKDQSLYLTSQQRKRIGETINEAQRESKEDSAGCSLASKSKDRHLNTELEKNAVESLMKVKSVPPEKSEALKEEMVTNCQSTSAKQKHIISQDTGSSPSDPKPSITQRSQEIWGL